jgi:hypothetical protein
MLKEPKVLKGDKTRLVPIGNFYFTDNDAQTVATPQTPQGSFFVEFYIK